MADPTGIPPEVWQWALGGTGGGTVGGGIIGALLMRWFEKRRRNGATPEGLICPLGERSAARLHERMDDLKDTLHEDQRESIDVLRRMSETLSRVEGALTARG